LSTTPRPRPSRSPAQSDFPTSTSEFAVEEPLVVRDQIKEVTSITIPNGIEISVDFRAA